MRTYRTFALALLPLLLCASADSAFAKKRKKHSRADSEEETITFDVADAPTVGSTSLAPSTVAVDAEAAPFATDSTALTTTDATAASAVEPTDSGDMFASERFYVGAGLGLSISGAATTPSTTPGLSTMRPNGKRTGFRAGGDITWHATNIAGVEIGAVSGLYYAQKGIGAMMTSLGTQTPYQPNPYQPNPYQPNPYQQNPYSNAPMVGTLVLDYIEIPLLAHVRAANIGVLQDLPVPLAPYISIGPTFAFAMQKSFQTSGFGFAPPNATMNYGSMDMALNVNIGIDGQVMDRVRAFFSIDYQYGLLDIDSGFGSYKSRGLSFNIGALYRL